MHSVHALLSQNRKTYSKSVFNQHVCFMFLNNLNSKYFFALTDIQRSAHENTCNNE
jgi:hypothetical protein